MKASDETSGSEGDSAASKAGRKRSEQSRLAILQAAFSLFAASGLQSLTIEGIAAEAGVGKQTIYRWWPSKAHVLMEAVAVNAELLVSTEDRGSFELDLRAFLTQSFDIGRTSGVRELLAALMGQAQVDPAFGVDFREQFLLRRRDALAVIVDRARARGDFPDGIRPGTLADVVFGVIWYRVLATGVDPDDALVDELTGMLAGGR
ncbi:TetR/AcrR family transcriptional regulator [Planctomonas sp. JC2975]|nr:TetR/AcrR family transcriptional regulator [Planctomonas sp. JC2975]